MTASSSSRTRDFGLRFGYITLALLSVIALAVTGYAYVTVDTLRGNIGTTDALSEAPGTPDDDDAVDILLVGSDARTDAKGRPLAAETLRLLRTEHVTGVNTDTLIIMRFPRDGGPPRAVSIPRDSWVEVPSGGEGKINSVFNTAKNAELRRLRSDGVTDRSEWELESDQAGRAALVQAVQDFTGVRLDHYAEVSMLGFYLLTEALGGVEVCLANATRDADAAADFAAGRQVVMGSDALSFVRQRKNLPRGDLDRIVRQQAFLGSALHKVLSAGTLANPAKLGKLSDAVERAVILDENLDLFEFAEKIKDVASGDVEFSTIPVTSIDAFTDDGQSIVEVNPDAVREFVANLITPNASPGGGSSPAGEPITAGQAPCVN